MHTYRRHHPALNAPGGHAQNLHTAEWEAGPCGHTPYVFPASIVSSRGIIGYFTLQLGAWPNLQVHQEAVRKIGLRCVVRCFPGCFAGLLPRAEGPGEPRVADEAGWRRLSGEGLAEMPAGSLVEWIAMKQDGVV